MGLRSATAGAFLVPPDRDALVGPCYVHPDVAAVRRLHVVLRGRGPNGSSCLRWIEAQAERLFAAHAAGDPDCVVQLRSGLGDCARSTVDEILAAPLTFERALQAVSVEHGFDGPMPEAGTKIDPEFETALDRIERGDLTGFRRTLSASPSLARARSHFGHGGTLLHYLTANGVEIVRQGVPHDAPRFAMALLESGADPTATLRAYGSELSVRDLFDTSAHPRAAGVDAEFDHVLAVAGV